MLLIECPCCGARGEETEFHCGGEAHIERRASDDHADADLGSYLFERKNPKGIHAERWRHQFGCGKWFHLLRDTRTLEIFGAYPITDREPPAVMLSAAEARLAARGLGLVSGV